jgi:hypothetical protein
MIPLGPENPRLPYSMGFRIVKAIPRCTRVVRTVAAILCVLGALADELRSQFPPWEVSTLTTSALGCWLGVPQERVALLACDRQCEPIPWQLDERGSDGEIIFDGGDLVSADDPPGIIDANDEVVFMTADSGREAAADELPAVSCRLTLRVRRMGEADRWLYAMVYPSDAPRVRQSYVGYDPATDTLVGASIQLGFRERIPQLLVLPDADGSPVNLLDRLKVRASARFLGLIPVQRHEGDLEAAEVGWRVGPVRVLRRQRQRIRVGWGIKSPRFVTDTYFYRTFAQMPVVFRLNFPPTYFFGDIAVETVLDFRDLRGWRVQAPTWTSPLEIGSWSGSVLQAMNTEAAEWFALIGPQVQLVQVLEVSPSLARLDKRLAFRAGPTARPPESVVGEMPGVGYALRGWGPIDRGVHAFAALTYVLPRHQDLAAFLRQRAAPASVEVLPPAAVAPEGSRYPKAGAGRLD